MSQEEDGNHSFFINYWFNKTGYEFGLLVHKWNQEEQQQSQEGGVNKVSRQQDLRREDFKHMA